MASMTRMIRLAVAATAALVLMTQTAQAMPGPLGAPNPAYAGAPPLTGGGAVYPRGGADGSIPDSYALQVARGALHHRTQVAVITEAGGFDWGAAAIGAGSTLAAGLIGAGAVIAYTRRRVPLSA
jgi:hypothetical protein